MTRRIGLGFLCKLLFCCSCAFVVLDGRHPPAHAQSSQETFNLAIAAAGEVKRVDGMVGRMDTLDARVTGIWQAVTVNANAIAGLQGEERGFAGVLIVLQIGSMVFAMKKKGPQ